MKQLVLTLCLFASFSLFGDAIVISDRHNFKNADAISNYQEQRTVKLKAPFISGSLDEEEWLARVKDKKIVVVIHGYNNDYREALRFFTKVKNRSNDFYDTHICYMWPGGDQTQEYFSARSRVTGFNLPDRLLNLLEDAAANGKSVDIIAHSMGCRLALEALSFDSALSIGNVFLMAAAIDNGALERGQEYSGAIQRCEKIYGFYSKNDKVVREYYPIVEWDKGFGAVGSQNPSKLPADIQAINCSSFIDSHGNYAGSDEMFEMIGEILSDLRMEN